MSAYRRKSPIIGGVLSFFFPGAGQLYNEQFGKALILISLEIAGIVTIIYTGVTMGKGMMYNGDVMPEAVSIVKIVTAGLIITAGWFYGIIDAVITATRWNNSPVTVDEAEAPVRTHSSQEGPIALGVVLIGLGIIGFLLQMGLRFEHLLKFGLPGALILLGG